MSGTADLLEVRDLTVRYGRVTAVNSVNFTVRAGQTVAIVGLNGAGKSTLLTAIMGLRGTESSGTVAYRGTSILGMKPEAISRLGVALVPERRHIFSRMSVLENLQLGTAPLSRLARNRAGIEGSLDLFPALRSKLHSPAGLLSGGQQQQLAIGRALTSNPSLLLLDEPSLGLSPAVIDTVFEAISTLRRSGITLIIVEQLIARAITAADRVIVLRHGNVVLNETADTLPPADAFTSTYMGV